MSWPESPLRDHRFEDGHRVVYCLEHGWMVQGNGRQVVVAQSRHRNEYHRQAYGYLMCAEWYDPEPDRLSIDLKLNEDLEPFVVFTTSSSWMDKQQVTEIRDYLTKCLEEMEGI
jgi:hypothetical protein